MMIGRQIGASAYDRAVAETHAGAAAQVTAAATASPAAQLQNALKSLGVAQGDPALSKLKVDGVIGKNTVTAMNYALTHYVSSQYFPKPNLTVDKVRQYAGGLASVVVLGVQHAGGTILPLQVSHRASGGGRLPALPSTPPPDDASTGPFNFPTKYVWYGVAGFSVLLILSMAAAATRRRREAAVAKA